MPVSLIQTRVKQSVRTHSMYVDVTQLSVQPIGLTTAEEFVSKHHYSHRPSSATRQSFGLYQQTSESTFFDGETTELVGVMTYGQPVGNLAVRSIGGVTNREVLELTRLVLLDAIGKNAESYFIGQSFRWLKSLEPEVKILISYADPEAGHGGTIYRATNWLYQGRGAHKKAKSFSYKVGDGEWIHSRSAGAKWGSRKPIEFAKTVRKTFWRKEESYKHRYLYFLCDKQTKKKLLSELTTPIIPFTKHTPFIPRIERYDVDGATGNIIQMTIEQEGTE